MLVSKQLLIEELLKFWDAAATPKNRCIVQEECKPSICDVKTSAGHGKSVTTYEQFKPSMSDTETNAFDQYQDQIGHWNEKRNSKKHEDKLSLLENNPDKMDDLYAATKSDTVQVTEDYEATAYKKNMECLDDNHDHFESSINEAKNVDRESKQIFSGSAPDVLVSALSKVNDSLDDWHFLSEIASSVGSERDEEMSLENFELEDTNVSIAFNHAIFSQFFQLMEKLQKMVLFTRGVLKARMKTIHYKCISNLTIEEESLQYQMIIGLFMTTGLSMIGLLASLILLLPDFF